MKATRNNKEIFTKEFSEVIKNEYDTFQCEENREQRVMTKDKEFDLQMEDLIQEIFHPEEVLPLTDTTRIGTRSAAENNKRSNKMQQIKNQIVKLHSSILSMVDKIEREEYLLENNRRKEKDLAYRLYKIDDYKQDLLEKMYPLINRSDSNSIKLFNALDAKYTKLESAPELIRLRIEAVGLLIEKRKNRLANFQDELDIMKEKKNEIEREYNILLKQYQYIGSKNANNIYDIYIDAVPFNQTLKRTFGSRNGCCGILHGVKL